MSGEGPESPKQKDVYRPSVQVGAPFQVWSMDILGPLHLSSKGHNYLLTVKDVFSKWFEPIPLSNTTSDKVLHALQMLSARFGHPFQVHMDNATYFRSQMMQEAFRRAGTLTYNPQSKSVERVHRELNIMLWVLCHQHAADWEEVLPAALLALRSTVHESTGVTPFAWVYRKEPATPLDMLCHFPGSPLVAHSYIRQLEDHQFKAHRLIQVQLACSLQRRPVCTGMNAIPSSQGKESGCSPPNPRPIANWPSHTPALGRSPGSTLYPQDNPPRGELV